MQANDTVFRLLRLSNDLPLAVRIKRAAFAMTMLTIVTLGGVLLALAVGEIPANQTKANQTAVGVIGEVMSGDARNQLGNLRQLSLSSLAWTALTDSAGREAYLKPFLLAREKDDGKMPIQLFDYRGREIVGSFPAAIEASQLRSLLSDVPALKRPKFMVIENRGQFLLLAVFPVVFPYSQDAIGALAGVINLSAMLKERSAGLGTEVGIEFVGQSRSVNLRSGQPSPQFLPVQFELFFGEGIDGQAPTLRLYSTRNPWLRPMLKGVAVSLLLGALLGGLVWWLAGALARRTTRRLNRLAESCAGVANGQTALVPEDSAQDEIGILSRTLRQTVNAHEQIKAHLQERVEEQTRELAASEARFRNFFENSSSMMLLIDPASGTIIDANKAAASYYGYAHDNLVGTPIREISRLSQESLFEEVRSALREGRDYFLFSQQLTSGEVRDTEVHLTPVESNGATLLFSVVRDITERKQAEEKLVLAANVFTHAREGIVITTSDGTIIDVNEAFTRITGYGRDEILGQNPRILKSGRHDDEFYAALWRTLIEDGNWFGEIWNRRKNGEIYPEMLTISAVYDSFGNTRQYVALFSDITAIKAHEDQLEHSAHYDALTQLPNRLLLNDRLSQGMSQVHRRGQKMAVVFLDLDGFKDINDRHGHAVGDALLVALASRMKHALREGDTYARLGGDEFVAVLLDLADDKAGLPTLERMLAVIAQPVSVGDLEIQVSASMGVTFYPQDESVAADQLLRQADHAMYQAKLSGKNRYNVFVA
jgi:diguanylate cyclase (GGDEF)-like protein/PAS domain S-box-containing protein